MVAGGLVVGGVVLTTGGRVVGGAVGGGGAMVAGGAVAGGTSGAGTVPAMRTVSTVSDRGLEVPARVVAVVRGRVVLGAGAAGATSSSGRGSGSGSGRTGNSMIGAPGSAAWAMRWRSCSLSAYGAGRCRAPGSSSTHVAPLRVEPSRSTPSASSTSSTTSPWLHRTV